MALLTKARQWTVALSLLALILTAAVGLVLTRQSAQPNSADSRRRRQPLVDEQPLKTARSIATLASHREEQRFAQQALKLADHEVDLAFASKLREATEHPVPPTPETRQLFARASKAEVAVKADQDRIDQLQKQMASANEERRGLLQQQMDLTKAQLELDQDELEDAKGDLIRSGSDPLSRIQRQFNRHETAQHEFEASHQQTNANNAGTNYPGDNLVGHFAAWSSLQGKAQQLGQAQDEAQRAADALKQEHEALEKQVSEEAPAKENLTQQAANQIESGSAKAGSGGATATAISALRRIAADQKNLADLDQRIQDEQDLANAYSNWILLVRSRQRAALHSMIGSTLWILLVLLAAYLAGRVVERFFTDLSAEHTRLRTIRVVVRFAIQALAVLLILFALFGTPSQMPTILGLAGAGLTVALKDFIVAFVGWFVLMGRNGIRVGDWVEINGVTGEVAEINLLRTVLLETGNWTDTGHPTGRKVAFVNSFAIEGHFFNFSTSGQWLWDEIQILVPPNQSPYPIMDAIQKMVENETEAGAHAAELEWQRAAGRYRAQAVSAKPAINLRPTTSGVEVYVRYITRASERYAMRTRLYQALVELLHRRGAEDAQTQSLPTVK